MNPNHDPSNGQFTSGPGGSNTSTGGDGKSGDSNLFKTEQEIVADKIEKGMRKCDDMNKVFGEVNQNKEVYIPKYILDNNIVLNKFDYERDGNILCANPDRFKEGLERTSAVERNTGLTKGYESANTEHIYPNDKESLSQMANAKDQNQCVSGAKYLMGWKANESTKMWKAARMIDDVRTVPSGAVIATVNSNGGYGVDKGSPHVAVVVGYVDYFDDKGNHVKGLYVMDQYYVNPVQEAARIARGEKPSPSDGRFDVRFYSDEKLRNENYAILKKKGD